MTVEMIKKDPFSYIIGMGDWADCITKKDDRFESYGLAPWVQHDNIVESQRRFLKELFEPVKDKIIFILEGNHEAQIHKAHDNDLTRNLCSDLGVRYGGYQAFLVLRFHRNARSNCRAFTFHVWHGAGSSQTEGARLMRLQRLVNDIEADVYLMGHLHAIASYSPDRLVVRNGRVKATKLISCITGSWLKGYMQPKNDEHLNPSYVERQGYKPSRIGCPVIKIKPYTQEMWLES